MNNIVVAYECASNGGEYSYQIQRDGWDYILDSFEAFYEKGHREVLLHRATGATFGVQGKMSMYSAIDIARGAKGKRARQIIRGLPAFLKIFKERFPDAKIYAYFGTAKAEPKRMNYLWKWNTKRALGPFFRNPQVTIVFDEAGRLTKDDPYYRIIHYVSMHQEVMVEPQPSIFSSTRLFRGLMLERWWRRYADPTIPGHRWWNKHETDAPDSNWQNIDEWLEDCKNLNCVPVVNEAELRGYYGRSDL